ncbi:transglutaminase family protein [Haloferula sp.]|uniref:transglutaminase family protein n=1 Tax=Haloferula sp. TaxID=2497595 RepID=UPI003C70851B
MKSNPRYQVRHRTSFHYAAPVSDSVNTLHLHPTTFPLQKTISCFVRIIPATRLRSFHDLFENITHHFEVPSLHQRLEVESLLKVENLPLTLTDKDKAATLDVYSDAKITEAIWPFLQPTTYVASDTEIWRQAVDLTIKNETVLEKAQSIMSWLHTNLIYDQTSTKVSSRIDEVFAQRSGVCQDFTHLMLGLCRSIGIPARYASGYLYNGPSDTLVGSQASHAWVEIHLPESGWIGLDPTNNTFADERFIKIAVGRDYDDVAPIKGQYSGTASCRMEVDVAVTHL